MDSYLPLPVILVTPPRLAAAPTMAYSPGVTHFPRNLHSWKMYQSGFLLSNNIRENYKQLGAKRFHETAPIHEQGHEQIKL